MVGDDHRVGPVVNGELRVLGGHHFLDDQRQPGEPLQPLQALAVQRRVGDAVQALHHLGQVGPVGQVRPLAHVALDGRVVAGGEAAHVRLPVAHAGAGDGDADRVHAGLHGAADQVLGDLVRVVLDAVPERAGGRLAHLGDRLAGAGAQGHHRPVSAAGARGGHVAIRVRPHLRAGGRHHHGEGDAVAEHGGGQVAAADVGQQAWADGDRVEGLPVAAYGDLVAHAAGDHVPVVGRQALLGQPLQVIQGERMVEALHGGYRATSCRVPVSEARSSASIRRCRSSAKSKSGSAGAPERIASA